MKRRALVLGAALLLIMGGALFLILPKNVPPAQFLGYVEAESILVGPKAIGRLVEVAVRRGDVVAAETILFTLDAETEQDRVSEATARLVKAKAQLADLQAAEQRPEQIDVLRATRRQAEAALEMSRKDYERQQKLFAEGASTAARFEQAKAAYDRDRAVLAEIGKRIETAGLSARPGQIEAARAEVVASEAVLRQAGTALDERKVGAPRGGRILDVFYREGEVVGAGQPVVEILPPENVLVRFYLPEPGLSAVTLGQTIAVSCDGCPPDLRAEVSFISPEAEFTPPVIFTREERAKLVFLVKARPVGSLGILKPGLPVNIALAGPGVAR